jgi:glycosyltransferase involved in cell wall biosynthesis
MLYVFWIATAFLLYTFVGYPLLFLVTSKLRCHASRRAQIFPSITVIIPAYNEQRRLAKKIENTLELEYPEELLEIMVASDGSTDETLAIAQSFALQGVKTLAIPIKTGKHHAQMKARELARGEILLFTDAAVRLDKTVLRSLVSNFADPNVGCVSSEDRVEAADSEQGESSYVTFEMWLRRLESAAGSIVSASGSFFAVRRELCDEWHPEQSSDFFLPLHVALRRRRSIVDPECIGYYGVTQQRGGEYQRKVRTIVHGLHVLFSHRELLNPFQHGFFAVQLISHKLFRWLMPFAALALMISSCFLWNRALGYFFVLSVQLFVYSAGAAATLFRDLRRFFVFKAPGFFLMGNAATVRAWISFCSGERFASWQPTQRA